MGKTLKSERVKDGLFRDLEETTLSFAELGEKYGMSRQGIFAFCRRKGIDRPKREHTKTCSICQSLLRVAEKPHSDFISSQTIKKQLGLGKSEWLYHLSILKKKGLISLKFGRLHSQKVERAYQIYFKKKLPVRVISMEAGLKNFQSTIYRHRALGWNVPSPLFIYDPRARKKAGSRTPKKKRSKS